MTLALLLLCLRLEWTPNPPAEEVTEYRIYSALEVSGPWIVVAVTTTNTWTITPFGERRFFYVTAVNAWGESGPSVITNTPAGASATKGLNIAR